MFSIKIERNDTTRQMGYGVIEINNFKESFELDTSFWQPADYKQHWNQAISRILRGSHSSCLLTSVPNPEHANFLTWWPMYRLDEVIVLQNGIFFLEDATHPFTLEDIYSHVPDRESVSDNGAPISEWKIVVDELSSQANAIV